MKKTKLIFTSLIVISFILAFSCSTENSEDIKKNNSISNLRKTTFENLVYNEMKAKYISLNISSKANLWIEKIDQILSQEIETENRNLILELKKELYKYDNLDYKKIKNIGIKLAKNMPEQQFLDMFYSLDNYRHKNYLGKKGASNSLIYEIESSTMSFSNSKLPQQYLIDCSCEWTCDDTCPNGVTTKCNPTITGCGFLWAYECEHACA